MKKNNLIALMSAFMMISTGACASEAGFNELPDGSGIVRVKAVELPSRKIPLAAPESDVSGTYAINTSYVGGSIQIRKLSLYGMDSVVFILSTVAGPTAHTADISGMASLNGDVAVFEDGAGCKLNMKFSASGVSLSGGNETCRAYMGMRGAVDGGYGKTGAAKAGKLDGAYSIKSGYTDGDMIVREFQPDEAAMMPSIGFVISTVSGSTAHTADISGVAVQNASGVYEFFGDKGCRLALRPQAGSFVVENGNETCRSYMGMRAAVDGVYSK